MPIKKIENFVEAAKFRIKFKDIFDLGEFYGILKDWLLEYGWSSVDTDGNIEGNEEYFETLYLEKEGAQGEKEHIWWWRLQKIPTDNSYYKFHLDINFHNIAIVKTEVVRDGKKIKANKGEIEMNIAALLEFDYKGEWSSHPFLKFFNELFPKRIFRQEIYAMHKLELYREAYVLQAFIKKWFKLKRFLPFEETPMFHPSKAYPAWKPE